MDVAVLSLPLSLSLSVNTADDLVDLKKPEVTGLEVSPASPAFSVSMIRDTGDEGEAESTESVEELDSFLLDELVRIL